MRSGIGPNDRILITGASGGVGSAAVQLAKLRGAEVIAVASAGKAEAVRELGADRSSVVATICLRAWEPRVFL